MHTCISGYSLIEGASFNSKTQISQQCSIANVLLNFSVSFRPLPFIHDLFIAHIAEWRQQDNCKRASILTNKVLKHSFVTKMESILDSDLKEKTDNISAEVEKVLMDPEPIGVNISVDSLDSCYTPIIQCGGTYDIKPSANNSPGPLTADIIIASMGSRYKGYCATVSRTYMVDAPPKVEKTYQTLLALYNHCLEQMVVGNELKSVLEKAKAYVESKAPELSVCLPKSLGFSIGLEFRDSTMVLDSKSTTKFENGMVFNLAVGFHNVTLSDEEKKNATPAMRKLNTFSLLLGDTVRVVQVGAPDVLTKSSKEFGDVSYNISGEEEEDEKEKTAPVENNGMGTMIIDGRRVSGRQNVDKENQAGIAASRAAKQLEIYQKKAAEHKRRLESAGKVETDATMEQEEEWTDLNVYPTTAEYPPDVVSTQIRVDLDREALIVPINGQPVAFHVSTIKNLMMPDPDRNTYLRINFYTSGAITKDMPKNMAGLIGKYGDRACFIKELTFRSLSSRNLAQVHMQYQELRKRVRTREQRAEQEKDLVVQQKLIRIKDQRVPRLTDLTMRPALTGKKCVGTLEAHQNGLRFTSVRGEAIDVLYSNIKHAIYQPCDVKTHMVLVHFHLHDFIMIGKKKHQDVTYYTEVVESSLSLEASKRSSYDPDEIEEEQKERETRRRLNALFKEFCMKVEKVASHYDFRLQMDVPFVKSAFIGNPHKEMVRIMPTTHCLTSLTETPVFCVTIDEIEHVHFERVGAGSGTKGFDIVIIFKRKTFEADINSKQIITIDNQYLEIIYDWLNLVEIPYTGSKVPMKWDTIFPEAYYERFYMDTEEDGTPKPVGWHSLIDINNDDGDDEEEDDESSYDEESSEESESESGSDDSSFEESEESEPDEDDSEEEGEDWDEMERKALAEDKAKRVLENSKGGDREEASKKKPRR